MSNNIYHIEDILKSNRNLAEIIQKHGEPNKLKSFDNTVMLFFPNEKSVGINFRSLPEEKEYLGKALESLGLYVCWPDIYGVHQIVNVNQLNQSDVFIKTGEINGKRILDNLISFIVALKSGDYKVSSKDPLVLRDTGGLEISANVPEELAKFIREYILFNRFLIPNSFNGEVPHNHVKSNAFGKITLNTYSLDDINCLLSDKFLKRLKSEYKSIVVTQFCVSLIPFDRIDIHNRSAPDCMTTDCEEIKALPRIPVDKVMSKDFKQQYNSVLTSDKFLDAVNEYTIDGKVAVNVITDAIIPKGSYRYTALVLSALKANFPQLNVGMHEGHAKRCCEILLAMCTDH